MEINVLYFSEAVWRLNEIKCRRSAAVISCGCESCGWNIMKCNHLCNNNQSLSINVFNVSDSMSIAYCVSIACLCNLSSDARKLAKCIWRIGEMAGIMAAAINISSMASLVNPQRSYNPVKACSVKYLVKMAWNGWPIVICIAAVTASQCSVLMKYMLAR